MGYPLITHYPPPVVFRRKGLLIRQLVSSRLQ